MYMYILYICDDKYRTVVDTTRSLDPTRPVTFACNADFDSDRVVSMYYITVSTLVHDITIDSVYGCHYDQSLLQLV